MKDTGEPDHVGEIRTQAGATATAVEDPAGGLHWEIHRDHDGRLRHAKKLAHLDHWKPVENQP